MSRARRSAHVSNVSWPTRLQDRRGVEDQVEAIVAPLEETVEEQGEALEQLEALVATSALVASADVELLGGRRGGHAVIERSFAENQVGAPVIVTHAPRGDEEPIVLLAGEVVSRSRLELRWASIAPAPRRTRVNFVVGLLS